MELHFKKSGAGIPLIILHGLYGSSDNWYTIGRELAASYEVFLIDQRNHGNSPHHPLHNYSVLSDDLYEFMLQHHLNNAYIIGHSMGGKTALAFGLKFADMIRKMVVVDISPLGYSNTADSREVLTHKRIITALQSFDPAVISRRKEADQLLQRFITPVSIRQFLLKNLKRSPEGKFYWSLNMHALAENMSDIFSGIIHEDNSDPQSIRRFPLLFIKGEYSGYIRKRDEEAIRQYFPWAEIITIPGAGHWVHAEQPAIFIKTIRNFLNKDQQK
jgi:esterase